MRMRKNGILITAITIAFPVAAGAIDQRKISNMAGKPEISSVESKYQACQGVTFVDGKEYQRNKNYWDQAIKTCAKPGDIQILSEGGFFDTQVYEATRSLAFLQEVGEKAMAKFDERLKDYENKLKCYPYDKVKTPECEAFRKQYIGEIHKVLPMMRKELAMSEGATPSDANSLPGAPPAWYIPRPEDRINRSLKKRGLDMMIGDTAVGKAIGTKDKLSMGVYRADDVDALTDQEAKEAIQQFQAEVEPVIAKYSDSTEGNLNLEYKKVQIEHTKKYMQLLNQYPILTTLGKASPNHRDVEAALKKLVDNAKKEKAEMEKTLKDARVEKDGTVVTRERSGRTIKETKSKDAKEAAKMAEASSKNLLDFMIHTSVIEDVLSKDKSYCGIATGLLKYKEDQEMAHAMKVMGVALPAAAAISVVFPPAGASMIGMTVTGGQAAALALGPPLGWYMINHDQQKFDKAKGSFLAGGATAEQVDQAEGALVGSWTFHPLDFLGTGFVGKAVYNQIAKGALKLQGLNADEAARLVKLATDPNKKVAEEAQRKIHDAALRTLFGRDVSKEEAEALELAGTRIGDREGVQELVDNIKRMEDRSERHNFVKAVGDALKKLDPNRFKSMTQEQRRQAMRAITAASNFGVKDSNLIAVQILNKWDEGVEGLTKTYQLAAKKLKDPAVVKITDVAERQNAAFRSALDEMMDQSPKFKAMSKEERDAAAKQMTFCGTGRL